MLDLRLWEIFTAPRNEAAWAACYVRAAWGTTFDSPYWVEPAYKRLMSIRASPFPDSFSIGAARDFVFAHECGHFFLDHLSRGLHRKRHFGGQGLLVFDPALRDEIEADKFARDLLCRQEGRPLPIQQMGVDWLFGFLGGVSVMRQRADARLRGRLELPIVNSAITKRRTEAWEDYNRRCAASPDEEARAPDNVVAVQNVRENVDNFNKVWPIVLADIYAVSPNELLDWQARVTQTQMSDDDAQTYRNELAQLYLKTRDQSPPPIGWRQRLRRWIERMF
jgi:hypothetical protein